MPTPKPFSMVVQRKIVADLSRFIEEDMSGIKKEFWVSFDTKAGPCTYSHSIGKNLLSIFFRFDNVESAKELVCDVGVTGKWNHHISVQDDWEIQLNYIKSTLTKLIPEQA